MTWLRHITGRAVWLLLGLAVAAALLLQRDDASAVEAAWQQQVKSFAAYRWTIRGLEGQVATVAHQAARLNADTAKLRWTMKVALAHAEAYDRLTDSLHRSPLRQVGEACTALVQNCEQRVLAQHVEDSLHFTMYRITATRSGQSDSLLAAGVKAVDTHHFHLAFVTLPKPKKWQVAVVGCLVGAFVDQTDRLRGCGIAGAGFTVASPTW